jgi:hypothetical protein
MPGGGETAHIHPDLSDDHGRGSGPDTGYLIHDYSPITTIFRGLLPSHRHRLDSIVVA